MKIADKTVVQMHYTLTSDEGKVIDSSEGREPLQYIQGAHMIVVGLEKAMVGHDVGDKFDVKVIPSEGYGEYNEEMTQEVPLDVFQGVDKVVEGMMFYAQTPAGPMPIRVKSVSEKTAVIDANHELAGQNLNFAIEVVSVREATEEDLKPLGHHCCCGGEGEGDHECECGGHGNKENCDGKGGCGCEHHAEHHG
ncbi:MAG: peptidylprolyl isomerase [Fibrobacter sp.]|nr:peptidylprolyl isomerase [Fibrobacter sp.]